MSGERHSTIEYPPYHVHRKHAPTADKQLLMQNKLIYPLTQTQPPESMAGFTRVASMCGFRA